jgi:hypothetical protein
MTALSAARLAGSLGDQAQLAALRREHRQQAIRLAKVGPPEHNRFCSIDPRAV